VEIGNAEGVMRVWQDVSGYHTDSGDYLVISNEARLKGERLTIYLATSDRPVDVQVLDSRPTVLNGLVRHQLRLHPTPESVSGTRQARHDDGLETQ
jgi:hypothetical protein